MPLLRKLLFWIVILSPSARGQEALWSENDDPVGVVSLEDCFRDDQDLPLRRYKPGAIQKLSISSGWVGNGGDDLNVAHVRTSIGLGVPLGSFDNILGVEPAFRVDFPSAPGDVDLPGELYDIGVQFFWRRELNERWGVMGIVSPSLRSDLTTQDDALRVFALGLLTYEWIPDRLWISGGAVALGRADIPVVPALGLKWTPTSRLRLDATFPRPRLAYRLRKRGVLSETWGFLEGALGGNTWAITRHDGAVDELSIRDLRMALGIEHLLDGGGGAFLEVGYAFNRRVEFERQQLTLSYGDAVLMNLGWCW